MTLIILHKRTCVATRLLAGPLGVRIPVGTRDFFHPERSNWLWGPPSNLFNGYYGRFVGIKRPGRFVNHSPKYCAEVKNEWSYTSTPIYIHGVDREKFFVTSILLQRKLFSNTNLSRICCEIWCTVIHFNAILYIKIQCKLLNRYNTKENGNRVLM